MGAKTSETLPTPPAVTPEAANAQEVDVDALSDQDIDRLLEGQSSPDGGSELRPRLNIGS
jgi:hypothetical protein